MSDPVRCPPKALQIDSENAHGARYIAEVPIAHSLEDVSDPDYFGLLQAQAKLRPGDFIAVRPIDYSWHAEFMVRSCEPGLNRVVIAELWSKTFDIGPLPAGWEIVFRGEAAAHVIRLRGEDIQAGFRTKEAAYARIMHLATAEAQSEPERRKPGPKPKAPVAPAETPAA